MNERHGEHGLGGDPRYDQAWKFVIEHQGEQVRKSADVPYTTHLRSVAALVLGEGGTPDEVIGAMLHDVVEDTPVADGGHSVDIAEVVDLFGQRVGQVVDFCTDGAPGPGEGKAPWRERKELHFEHLLPADPGTLRVVVADKADNISDQLRDLGGCAEDPVALSDSLSRFKGGFAGTLWYYCGIHAAVGNGLLDSPMYRGFGESIVSFSRCWAPTELELQRRVRLRLVLDRLDPSCVGLSRVVNGYYAIDASELSRRRSVPGAEAPEEIVERFEHEWYGENAWDRVGKEALYGELR